MRDCLRLGTEPTTRNCTHCDCGFAAQLGRSTGSGVLLGLEEPQGFTGETVITDTDVENDGECRIEVMVGGGNYTLLPMSPPLELSIPNQSAPTVLTLQPRLSAPTVAWSLSLALPAPLRLDPPTGASLKRVADAYVLRNADANPEPSPVLVSVGGGPGLLQLSNLICYPN